MAQMESTRVTAVRMHSRPGRNLPPKAKFAQFLAGLDDMARRPDLVEGRTLSTDDFPDHTVFLAFWYLDLIERDGKVTRRLLELVSHEIGSESWRAFMRGIVRNFYGFVFTTVGNDLSGVSAGRLSEAFEPVAPTKGTVQQCVEFFRKLCWAVDIPIRLSAQEQARQEAAERAGRDYPAVLEEFVNRRAVASTPPEPVPEPVVEPAVEPVEELRTDPPEVPNLEEHLRLQKAVADVLDVIGDPSNLDLCYEILREALPAQRPGEPPPIPPFDSTWDAETRSKWFDLRKLWLQHEMEKKA